MSLCVITANNDILYMAADSRKSKMENGIIYALNDDIRKIKIIHKKIIFGSGNCSLINMVWADFKNQPDGSLDKLQSIAKLRTKEFISVVGETEVERVYTNEYGVQILNLTVAEIDNGEPKIYYLENNDFVINEIKINDGYIKSIASGYRTNEVQEYINRIIYQYNDPIKYYKDIYSKFADEGIGGTLRIYKLEGNEITLHHKEIIRDTKAIRWG